MLCIHNETGALQFPATEVDTLAVKADVAHSCAMELCRRRPVIHFGSRTTSRLPCHHRLARGRTIVRVLPGERSSTKPLPEDRKAPPSNNERKAASGERKAASGECSDAPVG